jgi:hypothetical protein
MTRQTIAQEVRRNTPYTLKGYCDLRGLSYTSLVTGYVSCEAARVLAADGLNPQMRRKPIKSRKKSASKQ